ncbi:MAG: tRNA pseudouridine(55) synthase TruB [Anaerolineae bacterium]
MLSGLLNLNKPRLLSSHDIVNRVRRLTGITRAGHAGTLDPLASGVLVLCLGQATRVSEYVAQGRKTYLATLRLGQQTASYDAESKVTTSLPWEHLQLQDLKLVLEPLRGEISQVPPMYSAVKHNGKSLYKLARRGITIERASRQVTIYRCEITRWAPPFVDLRITCSGGTYIRTLAHDIGQALGCGAYLADLVREASGDFTLEDSVSLQQLQDAGQEGWQRYLLPMQAGLQHLAGIKVNEEQEASLRLGKLTALPEQQTDFAYAVNSSGQLFAILRRRDENGLWQPDKVLNV